MINQVGPAAGSRPGLLPDALRCAKHRRTLDVGEVACGCAREEIRLRGSSSSRVSLDGHVTAVARLLREAARWRRFLLLCG